MNTILALEQAGAHHGDSAQRRYDIVHLERMVQRVLQRPASEAFSWYDVRQDGLHERGLHELVLLRPELSAAEIDHLRWHPVEASSLQLPLPFSALDFAAFTLDGQGFELMEAVQSEVASAIDPDADFDAAWLASAIVPDADLDAAWFKTLQRFFPDDEAIRRLLFEVAALHGEVRERFPLQSTGYAPLTSLGRRSIGRANVKATRDAARWLQSANKVVEPHAKPPKTRRRSSILDPTMALRWKAKSEVVDPGDWQQVWERLVSYALARPALHPFFGYADGAIQYVTIDGPNEVGYLKRNAIRRWVELNPSARPPMA